MSITSAPVARNRKTYRVQEEIAFAGTSKSD